MRRSAHPRPRNKKQRALPYRLQVLREFRAWSRSFADYFPPASELAENPRYWNWKVPVDASVVEGGEARFVSQRELAQSLIDACAGLLRNKPDWAAAYRVTCVLCVPDLFSSELCIYLDEDYYRSKVEAAQSEHGWQAPIADRSLAAEWGLSLPAKMHELGVRWQYGAMASDDSGYVSDHWRYGEVAL